MDYLKVFVITDKDGFNEYIKENRNSDLTIIFDNYKDSEIHLVPVKVPNEITKRYIGNTIQEYDVFINICDTWEKALFYRLTKEDIDSLLDSKSIEDYEEYNQWEKIELYHIINKEKFVDFIYDRLSDCEKIAIQNESKKAGKQLYYLIPVIDESSNDYKYRLAVKFKNMHIAHIFPDITLNEDDIFVLTGDVIESLNCKIHKETNKISINNSKDYIFLSEQLGYGFPKICFKDNIYVASAIINNNNDKYHRTQLIRAFGKTKDTALSKLHNKILEIRNTQKQKNLTENKDVDLQHSIEDDFTEI